MVCWVTRCSWSTADIAASALQCCWNYMSRIELFPGPESEKVLHKSARLRSTLPNSLEEPTAAEKPLAGHRRSHKDISWLVPQNKWGCKLKDLVWLLLPDVKEIHYVPQYLDFCASVLVSLYLRPQGRAHFFFSLPLSSSEASRLRLSHFKINHCSTCERGQLWSAAAAWMNCSAKVKPHIPTETKHGVTHVVQMRHLEHFGYSSLCGVISLHISLVAHRRHPRLKRLRLPLLAFSSREDARGVTAIQLCCAYSRQSDSGAA